MKIFRAILFLIIAIIMTYAIPADAATWEDATGPYSTTVVRDTGPDKMYSIYRPLTLKSNTHPIVVLCIGTGGLLSNYDPLLLQLASHGVVVIASTDRNQEDGSKADAGVNWIIGQNEISKSEYYQKLIPSRVLAIGHSSGGNGATRASVKNSKITNLLLYAPALQSASSSDLRVPTFYISGSLDTTVPPHLVKAGYQAAIKANAWYGENKSQSHIGFGRNPDIQYYTRAWVYTHLLNDSGSARGCFYGPDWTFKNASTWSDKQKNNDAL